MTVVQLVVLAQSDTLVKLHIGTHSCHGVSSSNWFLEAAVAETSGIGSEFRSMMEALVSVSNSGCSCISFELFHSMTCIISQGLLSLKSGSLVHLEIFPATSYPFKYHVCLNYQNIITTPSTLNENLEWFCLVESEKLIRYVKGDCKLAIRNRSLVFSGEVRTGVVYLRDAGIEMVFMLITESTEEAIACREGDHPGAVLHKSSSRRAGANGNVTGNYI